MKLLEAARLEFGHRPIRKVMMPTDFSEASLAPLGLAVEFAAAAGAELHLLWVDAFGHSKPTEPKFPADEDVRSAVWLAAPSELHQLAEGARAKLRVIHAVSRGIEIAPAIVEYAEEESIDLLVIASSAHTGLPRFFLGSTTELVIRHSPCSVVVVGPEAQRREGNESRRPRILAAIDFSTESLATLDPVADLAVQLGADLFVLHVVAPPSMPVHYGVEMSIPQSLWNEVVERSEQEMKALVASLPPAVNARSIVRLGGVVPTFESVCEEIEADMVVLASHGLTGVSRFLLGSTAERTVRVIKLPVLVVRFKETAKTSEKSDATEAGLK